MDSGLTYVGSSLSPWIFVLEKNIVFEDNIFLYKNIVNTKYSGFDLYHPFRNDAFYGLYNLLKVQKTGKWKSFWDNLYRKRSRATVVNLGQANFNRDKIPSSRWTSEF